MNYYCESCGTFTGDDGVDTTVISGPSKVEGFCSDCQDKEDIKERKAKFDTYLETHDELIGLCEEWIDAFPMTGGHASDVSVRVYNEAYPPYIIADYTYYTYGGCDEQERDGQEKIPLSIFWDTECIAKERKKRWDEQMVRLKKNDEKKKVQDMKDKAHRYEKYIALKEEFESEED
jgi:hypothetical protein